MSFLNTVTDRWFPSTYHRGPAWLVVLCLACIAITLMIKLITGSSINRYPEVIFTLAFFYTLFQNRTLFRSDLMIWFFGIALAMPIVFFGINYLLNPELAVRYARWENLPRIMLFLPIAWWLGGQERNSLWMLTVAFLGLLLAVCLDPQLNQSIQRLLSGQRVDFGILNAQHVALYFSIALIGFLSFGHRALRIQHPVQRALATLSIVAGIIISLLVIFGTQTRAAWLGLLICAGVWLLLLVARSRHVSAKQPRWLAAGAVVLLLLVASGWFFKEAVQERLARESDTVSAIVSGEFDNIPYTSIGIRINTWREAMSWVAERPVTGWGGRVRGDVINTSEVLPDRVKQRFGHFHNSYLEFALAFGLPATLLIIAVFGWLVIGTRKAVKAGHGHNDTLAFTGYGVLLFAIMNLFESYLFFWSGVYASMVLMAPGYTIMLKHSHQRLR
ncbi:O-antigen ligase family protein [Natronospirillum operosum]|uniref:O-antigen ligase family protein n=1 Tax=Natronospirillum operosum TaxID=2759953 RepID=A0A4Z0WHW6_9GAMM|nr:O-antigen ligase family protein [Natronospirillum operosum]TGG95261.1 O-antigen ligase family protein [Natronospirillum operosum]